MFFSENKEIPGVARRLVCWKGSRGGDAGLPGVEHTREEFFFSGRTEFLFMKVFVSHLHAEYCRRKDIYLGHRVLQVCHKLLEPSYY